MVGRKEINDTEGDGNFSPNLSPVSIRSAERIATLPFNDNSSLLGVIVDRSSFDEDDELTTYGGGKDASSVIDKHPSSSLNLPHSHQQQHLMDVDIPSGSGGFVMRNGKVRRKLRWKPRFGKKKSGNDVSSNVSVVSALTNRSNSKIGRAHV